MPTTYIKSLPDWLSSRLAPEVYDVILDHLHTSKQDLSACSLVCRSWLPVCRYHLFGEMNYSADLARVIERSTHAHSAIVPYIRKVTIQGFNPLSNATKEKRMIFILNLPNLHHLHIEKCDWSRWGFPTSLSLDTPSVCRLSTLHLRSVHFPSFATLANFLDQFITLQNLSLDSLSWNELTYNSGQYGFLRTSVLKPSTLRKLHIVFCHNIVVLNWLQYGVISDGVLGGDLIQHRIFSHLVSVVVPDIQPTEATTFRAFIVTLGEPLEHLEMGILLQDHGGPNQSDYLDVLGLSSITKLKTLAIHQITLFQFPALVNQNVESTHTVTHSRYAWLPLLLSTVRSTNMLLVEFHIWISEQSQLDALPWTLVCEMLVAIRTSRIRLCITGMGRDTDSAKGWFIDRLGGNNNVAKSLLEFHFSS